MKAIVITSVATVLSFAVSAVLIYFTLIRNKKASKLRIVLNFIADWVVCFIIGGFVFFSMYYHATDNALSYLESTKDVKVSKISNGYYFDGPGEEAALIFYPGAKVEETAYAGIMYSLAEEGADCFLVEMPLHMAFMGQNRAESVMDEYGDKYDSWYIGGHSLGGSMAAVYTTAHPERNIKGLILLASYSTEALPEGTKALSLIASEDKVMSWNDYCSNLGNLPEGYREIEIEGGNHCQFGDYGMQNGDGTALITMEEQHEATVREIIKFIFDK